MPSLGGHITPQGMLIQVATALPGSVAARTQNNSQISLQGQHGLIDTGASKTSISPSVAASLNLTPIGIAPLQAAGGVHNANKYIVDLVLGFGNSHIVFPNLEVCEFNVPAAMPFQLLIGMDVLRKGVFTMSFDGRFTFSV